MSNTIRKKATREIKKLKITCSDCKNIATSFYLGKAYCAGHFRHHKPSKKSSTRGRRLLKGRLQW